MKKRHKFDDEYEGKYEPGYHDRLVRHRKDKKITNALRSKDVSALMDEDDDEFY